MGDENTVLATAEARHFLRRTRFGAKPAEVAALAGRTRGEAADQALGFPVSKKIFGGRYIDETQGQWFKYMTAKTTPGLQEKLVLFLHDHFATSNAMVDSPRFMARQNGLLREYCRQDFRALTKRINRDAAMMEFLDTVRNDKQIPNENYARELLELFTLGVTDLNGNPNYTQADVVQIARAFTGWRYVSSGKAYFDPSRHDTRAKFPLRGDKRIFTEVGGFGPGGREFDDQGEGASEIDRVVDHIFEHRDSDGEVTTARRLAARLIEFFCHGGYAEAAVVKPLATEVVAASGFDVSWNLGALTRAILVHDAFYETAGTAPFGSAEHKSLSWPADYIASTLRLLGLRPHGRWSVIWGGGYRQVSEHAQNMGQSLFEPPSVFGWDWEESWMTSATMLARFQFARDVSTARSGSSTSIFDPARVMDLTLTDGGAIVDAVVDACGVGGLFSGAERDVLIEYLTDGAPAAPVDLSDWDTREGKLRGLVALVLQSPACQLR